MWYTITFTFFSLKVSPIAYNDLTKLHTSVCACGPWLKVVSQCTTEIYTRARPRHTVLVQTLQIDRPVGRLRHRQRDILMDINTLNGELNPTCHLLALLGAHHILNVSRIMVNHI